MTTIAPFTVHLAGEPRDWIQRCIACGFVLYDGTAWVEGRIGVIDGDDLGPSWWPTGARVGTDKTDASLGGVTYVAPPELDHDERACIPA